MGGAFGYGCAASYPLYVCLNGVLDEEVYGEFVEVLCSRLFVVKVESPGISPGSVLRSHMIGYSEGIKAERGIAGRLKVSLSLRVFWASRWMRIRAITRRFRVRVG